MNRNLKPSLKNPESEIEVQLWVRELRWQWWSRMWRELVGWIGKASDLPSGAANTGSSPPSTNGRT